MPGEIGPCFMVSVDGLFRGYIKKVKSDKSERLINKNFTVEDIATINEQLKRLVNQSNLLLSLFSTRDYYCYNFCLVTKFCMEHMGIYCNYLLFQFDGIRIAEYAYRNQDKLGLWQPKREIIQQLAHLSTARSGLVEIQKTIKTTLKEMAPFLEKSQRKLNKYCLVRP